MKIVFFLGSLYQPRCIKRIESLYKAGFSVEVYGYSRGIYDVNKVSEQIPVKNWGLIKNGKGYFYRFYLNFKNIWNVVKSNKCNNVIYYAFGQDLAFPLLLLVPNIYIYESSDLIYTYFRNKYVMRIFQYLDLKIINKSYRTVFTSLGFKKYLFGDKNISNIIIQPNKVSPYFKGMKRKSLEINNDSNLTFAYVGAFRYPNTVFRFARIVGELFPKYRFYFFGDSALTPLVKDLENKYPNVKYFGKFESPFDLREIYNKIDLVVACYDTTNINEKIAEPNKLYESICFCRPIIVSNNTFLSERVSSLKVGFSINASNDEDIINFIKSLRVADINRMSKIEEELDESYYIDDNRELIDSLKQLS